MNLVYGNYLHDYDDTQWVIRMTSNLETIEGAYEAFARGDIEGVVAILDDDITWVEAAGGPYGGTYRGPEEVVQNVFAPLGTEWDEFIVDPSRLIDGGDTVVALGTYTGTYSETGKSVEADFAHVFDLEDGQVVRFQQYTDTTLINGALVT